MKQLSKNKTKISLTVDVCTTKTQLPFMGITVNYIDEDWILQSKLCEGRDIERRLINRTKLCIVQQEFCDCCELLGKCC